MWAGLNSERRPVKPFHLPCARVAEWQTRKAQDLVKATSWGFKSPLSHHQASDLRLQLTIRLAISQNRHKDASPTAGGRRLPKD